MLAMKVSLVSCSGTSDGSMIGLFQHDARIEPTTGLQISQPMWPLPWRASMSSKLSICSTRAKAYSSWRVKAKCSHRLLSTATPRAVSSCSNTLLSSAEQPAQPVAALVQALIPARSVQPPSMAEQIAPLLTLWQEQMVALVGRGAAPKGGAPSLWGRIRLDGSAGSAMPFCAYCSRVSY